MAKIARPALSNAIQYFKSEWRGIIALSIKTYLMAIVVYIVGMIPMFLMIGPAEYIKMHSTQADLGALSPKVLAAQFVIGIISYLVMMWIHAPLYISLSRGVVLSADPKTKEPFNRMLFSQLTTERAIKVTKVLALMVLLLIPFYVGLFVFIQNGPMNAADAKPVLVVFLPLFFIYIIGYIYIVLRLTYLIPAFSVDHEFDNSAQAWDLTQRKAWPVFKLILLTLLFSLLCIILFILALVVLSIVTATLVKMAGSGTIAVTFVGATTAFFALAGIIAFYLIFPQLMSAGIASIYLFSEQEQK